MHATAAFPIVGVDLSKHVFELAVANDQWRIVERARLSRMRGWLSRGRWPQDTSPSDPLEALDDRLDLDLE